MQVRPKQEGEGMEGGCKSGPNETGSATAQQVLRDDLSPADCHPSVHCDQLHVCP